MRVFKHRGLFPSVSLSFVFVVVELDELPIARLIFLDNSRANADLKRVKWYLPWLSFALSHVLRRACLSRNYENCTRGKSDFGPCRHLTVSLNE